MIHHTRTRIFRPIIRKQSMLSVMIKVGNNIELRRLSCFGKVRAVGLRQRKDDVRCYTIGYVVLW